MVAPIFRPNEREMIKYSPPPSTRLLVANSDIARAVGIVTVCPRSIINITPQKPKDPTANPKRKNKTAPRIVDIAVKYTGAVPKPFDFDMVNIFTKDKQEMQKEVNPALKNKGLAKNNDAINEQSLTLSNE